MKEPTRPIRQPTVERDGSLVAHTVATPTAFKVRARVTIGSRKVIPVIFVPGIMGSNLRARADMKVREDDVLKPGEAAWRPPNDFTGKYREADKWETRSPSIRQRILDAGILEVDPGGELNFPPCALDAAVMRERGWGEVYADSYGALLVDLQRHLDKTFQVSPHGMRQIRQHWKRVMQCGPERWGVRQIDHVTEAELERFAVYQYPVYAFGYNWLESCDLAAKKLRERIDQIRKFWTDRKHECRQVILVTHSMGGLVARACARASEEAGGGTSDIAGIVHAVMPALGAPVAYRRIACGTEGGNFTNGAVDNARAAGFADVAGDTSARTTPVMAVAPGLLQLLPNHLYPKPWLVIKTIRGVNASEDKRDMLSLPDGNPYDLYRDMSSWHRMIDPGLADPAGRYTRVAGGVRRQILEAIKEAERFHTQVLSRKAGRGEVVPYYHAHSYAFYGSDKSLKAYGQIRWVARIPVSSHVALTPANLRSARLVARSSSGAREVEIEQGVRLNFVIWPQDAHGDETVPAQSGAGPASHVRRTFSTAGFRHQDSFHQEDLLLLTRHLIVKIVQEVK
jgi:pimeloyl-ACP methyl ester carboxylesterase